MISLLLRSLLFPALVAAAVAAERPNILWIVSDDLGIELGCYGEPAVQTPHLDRLAAEGVRFTNAFATSPVCSSARSALITGMYQTSIGAHHHRTRKKKPLPKGVRPVTEHFRKAGYFVSNGSSASGLNNLGKTDYNFYVANEKAMFDGTDWTQRSEGQPFFAQVQIKEPHRVFPIVGDDVIDAKDVRLPPMYPDHPVARADWRNYLAAIQIMDAQVGTVLQRLDDEGLAENTVVLFFGDHGRPHLRGKQWLYDGGIHIPLIMRWPGKLKAGTVDNRLVSMIDFAPTSLAAAGIPVPENMQGIDINADKALAHWEIYAARDRCGDAIDRIRCVRSGRYKYIRNFMPEVPYMVHSGYKKSAYPVWTLMEVLHARGELQLEHRLWMSPRRWEEELYDLKSDPHELLSVAGDPAYEKVLVELRDKLDGWIRETGDQGAEVEGDARFYRGLKAEKRRSYARTMQKRGLDPDVRPDYYLRWWEEQLGVGP